MCTIPENIKKLGFGLMRLPIKDECIDTEKAGVMIDAFINAGFTYFDTAYVYHHGKSENAVKELLVDRYERSRFLLATKLALWLTSTREDMEKQFDEQLRKTGAGYFDFYLIHSMNEKRLEFSESIGAWDFVKGLKEKGLIRHIGFSFHDTADVLEKIIQRHPEAEFVQLQINYCDWESESVQSRLCYEVARKYGKKIIIMEPVKGGLLANPMPKAKEVFNSLGENLSPASYAIRFAASLEGVITVLSGMSTPEQVYDNISYMSNFAPLSEKERDAVKKVAQIIATSGRVPCTECSYCTEGCPSKINIPGIIEAYNSLTTYCSPEIAKKQYGWSASKGGKASDCIGCGACADICPQHIDIPGVLEKASSLFDKN